MTDTALAAIIEFDDNNINTTHLWHNAPKRLNYLVVNNCQQSQVVVELLSRVTDITAVPG